MAFYDAIPASDGTSLEAPTSAEFKVFEVHDTARTNPLPLLTTAGLNAAPLVTTAQGVVPPVEVVSPNFEHIFVSGGWAWRRDSFDGMKKDAVAAREAAEDIQRRIVNGELGGGGGGAPTTNGVLYVTGTSSAPRPTSSTSVMVIFLTSGTTPPANMLPNLDIWIQR